MSIGILNENSRCWVKAKFYDGSDMAQIPTALRYRIDCETTKQVVLDWSDLTPFLTVEVLIPATLTKIININNATERKAVTFEANPGTPDAFNEVQRFDVINVLGQGTTPLGPDYGLGV
jgi:hypothetical protein